MSDTFTAWWATEVDGKAKVELSQVADNDLAAGEVTVGIRYSTINYKDGMAVQGMHTKRESVTIPDLVDAAHLCEALLRA